MKLRIVVGLCMLIAILAAGLIFLIALVPQALFVPIFLLFVLAIGIIVLIAAKRYFTSTPQLLLALLFVAAFAFSMTYMASALKDYDSQLASLITQDQQLTDLESSIAQKEAVVNSLQKAIDVINTTQSAQTASDTSFSPPTPPTPPQDMTPDQTITQIVVDQPPEEPPYQFQNEGETDD